MLSRNFTFFSKPKDNRSPEDKLNDKNRELVLLNDQLIRNNAKYKVEVQARTAGLMPLLLDLKFMNMPLALLKLIQSYDFSEIDSLFKLLIAPIESQSFVLKNQIIDLETEIEEANLRSMDVW